tara:strand:+ start:187 stop:342 length:156 start_codon:yes stop_codon:yes gene_type:complete
MTFKNKLNVHVNMCYELNGHRECVTLDKNDALNLRDHIDTEKGAVWWFSSI